jgi:hypothetical protein
MLVDTEILVADECWIALARLHKSHPERKSFSAQEILDQVREEGAHSKVRPGIPPHIYLHNVANLPPNAARYRMFYRLEDGTYRLFGPGDDSHPSRHGKTCPRRADLPTQYHDLLDWYQTQYCASAERINDDDDPVLQMRGVGKEIWAEIGGDAHIESLRSGWSGDDLPISEPRIPKKRTGPSLEDRIWSRVLTHQGEEFYTKTHLPFTYRVEGNTGIWFSRSGREINKRLSRSHLEEAVARCPLANTMAIKDLFDPSYLFGLLMDRRIRDKDW